MRKSTAQPFCFKHNVDKKLNSANRYICNQCNNEKRRILRGQNPEHYKAIDAAYYQRQEVKERQKKWLQEDRKNNPERYKIYNKTNNNKDSELKSLKKSLQAINLSLEKYFQMLEECNNKCMICKKDEIKTRQGNKTRLCIDHCHTSGKIRGLLCHKCNAALGMFEDNTDSIQEALNYLNKHKQDNHGLPITST